MPVGVKLLVRHWRGDNSLRVTLMASLVMPFFLTPPGDTGYDIVVNTLLGMTLFGTAPCAWAFCMALRMALGMALWNGTLCTLQQFFEMIYRHTGHDMLGRSRDDTLGMALLSGTLYDTPCRTFLGTFGMRLLYGSLLLQHSPNTICQISCWDLLGWCCWETRSCEDAREHTSTSQTFRVQREPSHYTFGKKLAPTLCPEAWFIMIHVLHISYSFLLSFLMVSPGIKS